MIASWRTSTLGERATAARHDDDDDEDEARYEVWVIDQSNTKDDDGNGTLDSGGTLYVYQGDDLSGYQAASAVPEVLDLGGAARDLCLTQTGTAPVRPHMFFFNGGRSHAVIVVGSGTCCYEYGDKSARSRLTREQAMRPFLQRSDVHRCKSKRGCLKALHHYEPYFHHWITRPQ